MKVVSKYPMMTAGEQFVMITGNCQKPLFSAVSWDSKERYLLFVLLLLEKGQGSYGWMMSTVLETKQR